MTRKTILVVEDEPDIAEVMSHNLSREGFMVSVEQDGARALERVLREAPDLLLLDLMLPGMDGLEVCRAVKAQPVTRGVPVIMVTAKGEESDVVLGLGLGADDYIAKPFSPRELVARVHAVLRRGPLSAEPGQKRIQRQDLIIDIDRHRVTTGGSEVVLTPTEFRLLSFLAAHPGRVFSRDMLLSRVIGEHAVVIDRNIDVHVRSIRKKLGAGGALLETVRGLGYRFREDEGA